MKRINFKELRVEERIGEFILIDVRKEIGNALHAKAMDIAMDELARKIYHSEGEIDIPDSEFNQMTQTINSLFYMPILLGVKNGAIDIEENQTKEEK